MPKPFFTYTEQITLNEGLEALKNQSENHKQELLKNSFNNQESITTKRLVEMYDNNIQGYKKLQGKVIGLNTNKRSTKCRVR